ncbi:MAG: hypothetical protein E7157_01905 [Lactobacillales bacterium]|nr:hypothetical protein [Lactobacillales bacterium]
MTNNNKIKNRYFEIIKDNNIYAYISVKKDFYVEGILVEDKYVLSGYFPFYNKFNAFILDNSMQSFEHYLDGICIIPNETKKFDITGKIICDSYTLYDAEMDEYCYVIEKKEKSSNLQIKLIEDEELIKDINYLIRSNIRNLNSVYMFYYNSLKNHRYGNLKELISDLKWFYEEDGDTSISLDTIEDLKIYLNTLDRETTKEENQKKIEKSKRKNMKKKR